MKIAPVVARILASLLYLSGLTSTPCSAREVLRKPNIVLIVADDLGYGELGVQGYRQDIPTPNIDSIAQNGVRFSAGYVSAPVCSPTRAGLMTGRYQQRYGHEFNKPANVSDDSFALQRAETTLSERLKVLGYATGIVGKWHLGVRPGAMPTQRGFDEFFGFMRAMHPYFPAARQGEPILRGLVAVDEREYLTDAFAREAVSFVERHKNGPFFLYLPFNAVHLPLQAPEKYQRRFGQIKDQKRQTFAAMLAAMDDAVGLLLNKLQQLDLTKNTLIFFISDNGGPTEETTSSNGVLRGKKGELFDGGIRVPFFIQWKTHLPSGKVDHTPVISLDIFPTAIAAAGGAIDDGWKLDGVNMLPYLTGQKTGRPHDALFWRMRRKHAVREGDWKLVLEKRMSAPALYDLAHDIGEKDDLAGKLPERVKALDARYQAWDRQMTRPGWESAGRPSASQSPWERFDRNGDGKLTPEEFPRPSRFRRLDRDGDGVLTEREFKQWDSSGAKGKSDMPNGEFP